MRYIVPHFNKPGGHNMRYIVPHFSKPEGLKLDSPGYVRGSYAI